VENKSVCLRVHEEYKVVQNYFSDALIRGPPLMYIIRVSVLVIGIVWYLTLSIIEFFIYQDPPFFLISHFTGQVLFAEFHVPILYIIPFTWRENNVPLSLHAVLGPTTKIPMNLHD